MNKIILHLDMNSYFASVEQQANSLLRGRPVGICEHLGGLIIAPSVEAKRIGIKLGTPVWEARKICPQIVLLPVDPDKYRHVTRGFLRILADYGPVEKSSIDEAFVNLTAACADYRDAWFTALEIKQRLRRDIGPWVSASIGIGPNKLIAKIAADLGEGDLDRIALVTSQEVQSLPERLSLINLPGIGPKMERALHKLGIFTVRQLAEYPLANLLNRFGLSGFYLSKLAKFEDVGEEQVFGDLEEIKSIGHSYTLARPISRIREIKKLMLKLAEKIGRRLRRQGKEGNVVHYFHSDRQYHGFYRQQKLGSFIADGREIYEAAWRIFETGFRDKDAVKIMGITVSGLRPNLHTPMLLPQYEKFSRAVRMIDQINDKYGEFSIFRGRLLGIPAEWGKDTVGFGRIKEFTV